MSTTEQLLSKMEEERPFDEMMEQGEELLKRLDYSAALRHYDRVLKSAQKLTGEGRDYKVAKARNRYAKACQVVGRWDRAQREYRRVVESELEGEDRSAIAEALIGLGVTMSRRGERDEARDHFVEARDVAEDLGLPQRKAEAMCHIAAASGRTGELEEAKNILEDARQYVPEQPQDAGERELSALYHSQWGLYYFRTGNNGAASESFQKALDVLGDQPSLEAAASRRYLGVMCSMRGQHRQTLEHHLEGLRIYKLAGCRYGQAKVYDSIGRTFAANNRMEEAIFSYKKAESICRRLGANSELATLYGKLGQVYMIREDYETAVKYFRRDLDISSRNGNYYALGYSYRNLGRSLIQVGITEEAITNLKESIGLFQYVEDQINLGRVYMDLTQAYVKAERAHEAKEVATKAEAIFEEQNMDRELAFLKCLKGVICRLTRDFANAEKLNTEAIEELPEKGPQAWRAEAHYELGILYRQQKRYPEAVAAFRDALDIARAAGLSRHTGRYLRDIESLDETELYRAWMKDLPEG
jgi:tetratricopeptide (TPR) repeat protein